MTMPCAPDIVVVGGGVGGCAAALGAVALGRRVVLTEESDWLGGQFTTQAVPPDENPWIESFGCTRRYRDFRNSVRAYYRDHYPLTPEARDDPHLNPGKGIVSRLCFEPRIGVAVLDQMMAWAVTSGKLVVKRNCKPVACDVDGDRVQAVSLADTRTGTQVTMSADYFVDATELGDLLALSGTEYVTGAESRADTGEPHAVEGMAQPGNTQALTHCLAVGYDPHGEHTIDRPGQYARWRDYSPGLAPPWPGRLLDWTYSNPVTLAPCSRPLLPGEAGAAGSCFWTYRRLVCCAHYLPAERPREVTLVNWPQNDYVEGSIIDQPHDTVQAHLDAARQLSLSLLYWMQTEAPRPDGGCGYPGLYPRPDITDTPDGLAKAPYVRESRRIKAMFTVKEQHVVEDGSGRRTAERYADSVGIGYYRIDLHPSVGGDNYIDLSSLPFQVPLGALVPVRMKNLLPACKNIGTTHITNGCYRLHPVEWNIGEVAGLLAAFCLERGTTPHQVHGQDALVAEFQDLLAAQGIELQWPASTDLLSKGA